MLGDLILWVRKSWEQFFCIHDYKVRRADIVTGSPWVGIECVKCGKSKR